MSGDLRFQVYQDQAGEYRWRLVAGNGEVMGDGAEGYTLRKDVHRALDRVRGGTATAEVEDV